MALTPRQEKAAIARASGMTQSDAYRSAYDCSKHSCRSIWNKASALFRNPEVVSRVGELQAMVAKETVIDAAYVLDRLCQIDKMTVKDILNDDMTLKPLSQWPDSWCCYLTSIDVSEISAGQRDPDAAQAFIKKLKWPDKVKNLELMGKHIAVQAFRDNANISGVVQFQHIEREVIDPAEHT